ncbi:alkane 1-monooxygenase [Alkalisalibacterium limincola]|uniref:Alkane 1-monooxygenase n=1 Tax=Alkalisalibacterium limincola TaxID=2699169 RepID=A0A5C8KWC4_9GAMM|nr:alkane 1-monooxygenase [Alkalisalibacterium limincola]TXK64920.1 alkane 1-monooxygenase [Alkalisalibacterium limincola]
MNASAIPDQRLPWRDGKRHAWLLSLLVPALVGAGPLAWLWLGHDLVLWAPLVLVYVLLPLLDALVGEDRSNPPESAVAGLESDPYYRRITWALVPMLWAAVIFAAWFATTQPLPWHGLLAVVLSTGVVGGFCINVGHELGHKRSPFETWLARLILAPTAYGHFRVEHNRGHHRDVATPADPASSRMGESIYRFMCREIPGAWRRAWALERERLAARGRPAWHPDNEIVLTGMITLVLWTALVAWLGPPVLLFLVAASFWANFQLTSANYIEHYGLLRRILPDGRREPCGPQHSWNSNHLVSNLALFQLQRHADHHAHATRRFQSLRHFDSAPQLPAGYFGMFLLAYVPPLWFRVMDPRVVAQVGRDGRCINIDPARRSRLLSRHGLAMDGEGSPS